MHGTGRNIAAFAGCVGASCSAVRQDHFAIKDNVRGFGRVRVIGIKRVRPVLPDVGVDESFTVKLAFQ